MKHLYNALVSKGFVKAFFYSFGSFLAGWIILFINDPDIALTLGQYAGIIPLINVVAVGIKQYFDELKK